MQNESCLLYTSNKLWLRRQTTKFNGVPYVVQRAAAAVVTESGMAEIQSNLDYYRRNAKVSADALDECGVWYCGGKNSPYIWPVSYTHLCPAAPLRQRARPTRAASMALPAMWSIPCSRPRAIPSSWSCARMKP